MISLPYKPKVIEKKENSAIFEIEALYPGYGVTIGNSLRRTLYSSLSGAAITQMKIKGAGHEFSAVPDVLEDVITIGLNLKQLRFKMHSSELQKATLKVKGEKEIKGSDFKFPSTVELINKDAHVATLTSKKAELEMEIQIEKGIGYLPSETRKRKKLEVGVINLDAIFTPIKQINYRVENMRVGDRTDYDRLFMEIETDGSVTPEEVVARASEILVNHFSLIKEAFSSKSKKETTVKKTAKKSEKKSKEKKTKPKKRSA